ncbi:MAG: amyH [Collimonas fungivorans]|uniref:hypothetical protein n=1 Tax=Collimonas fungivorans TaxID=158899 RepID=UPI0026EDA64F|nr:hypothetical protein [Collimonas fungivorans]MDB5766435.1 amyH [Collimonas fungivorans]
MNTVKPLPGDDPQGAGAADIAAQHILKAYHAQDSHQPAVVAEDGIGHDYIAADGKTDYDSGMLGDTLAAPLAPGQRHGLAHGPQHGGGLQGHGSGLFSHGAMGMAGAMLDGSDSQPGDGGSDVGHLAMGGNFDSGARKSGDLSDYHGVEHGEQAGGGDAPAAASAAFEQAAGAAEPAPYHALNAGMIHGGEAVIDFSHLYTLPPAALHAPGHEAGAGSASAGGFSQLALDDVLQQGSDSLFLLDDTAAAPVDTGAVLALEDLLGNAGDSGDWTGRAGSEGAGVEVHQHAATAIDLLLPQAADEQPL